MPTNLGPEAISAIKAGHADVVAMYAGDTQIFPNEVVLQSAAYTDTSTMPGSPGGDRIFRVTGELGSTYDLSQSLSGSFILTTSPFDHTVTADYNYNCGDPTRSFPVTLTPTGSTVLAGGGNTFTSSFSQTGRPSGGSVAFTTSISVVNTNYVTTTYNGNLAWAQGASWDVTFTWSGPFATNASIIPNGASGLNPTSGTGTGASGSLTTSFTLTSSTPRIAQYWTGYLTGDNSGNCQSPTPYTTGTGQQYP